ncbi:TetR/AcrR family transcriptional regulator [Salinarimonas rosea]|uniref:TetR/AcrR family transcriptional regulator n=1 Tax=Salinarimonas rosea TaxID=552063 RepID=UPI00048D1229|nr:TetR/AcrR family transcriptional regulator [Salinarimonas rosea]
MSGSHPVAVDPSRHSRPVVGPRISLLLSTDRATLDTPSQRIRFTGESRDLVEQVFPLLNGSLSLDAIASKTGYSPGSIYRHFDELGEDDAIAWLGCSLHAQEEDDYFESLRLLARFWNRAIFCEPVAMRIFGCTAHVNEVRLWALEFFCFIRAANAYMAKGVSRLDIPASLQEIAVRHYVDEAEHEEIFREGLLEMGFTDAELDRHVPLPSTQALLNFLFETASGDFSGYLALFTVMQPLEVHPTSDQITAKYETLADAYPPVAPFFKACMRHDLIDAGLGHSEWGLEALVRATGLPGHEARRHIEDVMMQTSAFFCLFYRGIGRQQASRRDRAIRHPVSAAVAFR